ncbi:MAG: Cys-rich protein [Leptospiraceae bacterium]|nr:Cys-rich protein [Leptospiraceae bacterium]
MKNPKNTIKSTFKSNLLLLLAASLMAVTGAFVSLEANPQCNQACDRFESCAIEIWKQNGRTIPATEKRKLKPGCMNTCQKHSAAVMSCYQQASNSCMSYWQCISQKYKQ